MLQTVVYNSFTFPYTTLDVSESAVFADDGITLEGTRYDYTISGFIYAGYSSVYPETVAGFNRMISDMQARLYTPRKSLLIQTIDEMSTPRTVFTASPDNDTRWGPLPGDLRLTRFAGGLAARYTWNVSTTRKDCYLCDGQGQNCSINGASGTPSYILSCVRRYEFSVDHNGMTTRTISGKLVISARAILDINVTADSYRYTVTPPIPKYFQRTGQSFGTNEAGTELSFSITDTEQNYTLPQPMSGGEATFSAKVEPYGAIAHYSLSGYFEAPPSIPKSSIITRIVNLITAYFPISAPGFLFTGCEISNSIYQNRVSFNFSGDAAAGVAAATTSGGDVNNSMAIATATAIQSPPESDGTTYAIYPDGGDVNGGSGVGTPPVIPYDACAGSLVLSPNSFYQRNTIGPGDGSPGGSNNGTGVLPTSGVSDGHQASPYIAFFEQISYEFDSGLVIFYPKVAGARPIKQQTRNPRVIIIQAGYAKRFGQSATAAPLPNPPCKVLGDNCAMLQSFVSPCVPEPVSDGNWNLYTVHWRYVMADTSPPVTDSSTYEMPIPQDPRRPAFDASGAVSNEGSLSPISNLISNGP